MDLKSSLVKSKSSNNTNSMILQRIKKISRSNATFQPTLVKKRGVYVENKTITNKKSTEFDVRRKPPPRPKPGQKRFLASALTILSKSTTGTQYPDIEEVEPEKNRLKPHNIKHEDKILQKRKKFKSRVLNKQKNERNELKVLQSRKYIDMSQSNCSVRSINASKITQCLKIGSTKMNPIRNILNNNGVTEGKAKEILEAKRTCNFNNNEPDTVIADISDKDDKMFNFFVDLLKTTFSVYNLNTEDEIPNEEPKYVTCRDSLTNRISLTKERAFSNYTNNNLNREIIYPIQPKTKNCTEQHIVKKIKKPHTKFVYVKTTVLPKSKTVDSKLSKKNRKKEFLDSLKQQIIQRDSFFVTPRNLFEELKLMAKNKKRCKKAHFYDYKVTRNSELECTFKGIKIISPAKTKEYGNMNAPKTAANYVFNTNAAETIYSNPSYHSLEVYDYDD